MAYQPTPLKTAIFQSGRRQREIAKKTSLTEARLSELVNGKLPATEDEKKKLARVLKMPIDKLFPEALSA